MSKANINIEPLNEYLVVEVIKNENEGGAGGVLLPDSHKKEEYGVGRVLAVDSGCSIDIGDKVVFDKYLLISVKIEGEELKFLKFTDVLGIIKEELNVTD